jgi:hypothetical protein
MKYILVGATILGAASLVQADITMAELSPKNSIVVAGSNNMEKMVEQAKASGLMDIWEDERLQGLRDQMNEQMLDQMKEFKEQLDIEEMPPWPNGPVGMSVFSVTDPETGFTDPGVLAYASYDGDSIALAKDVLDKLIEKAEAEGEIEVEESDLAGADVRILRAKVKEGPWDSFPAMYLFQKDGHFLIGSDSESVAQAIEVIGGGDLEMLSADSNYQGLQDLMGDKGAYVCVMMPAVWDMVASTDSTGMFFMVQPTISALLGDLKSVGMSMGMNHGSAMIEAQMAAYMPEGKTGLMSLIGKNATVGDLPSFVSSNTISVSEMSVDFAGIMPMMQKIIRSSPMLAMQAQEMMTEWEPRLTKLFGSMGTRVYNVTAATKPYSMETIHSTYALECKDAQAFETALAEIAPMAGMQPRDFVGNRIYSMNAGGAGASFSIGIGGGWVFMGTDQSVEQGLRSAGAGDVGAFSTNASFRTAMATLPGDSFVSWSYTEIVEYLELAAVEMEAGHKEMLEQIRQFDPDAADEMAAEGLDSPMKDMDMELLREYFGAVVSETKSVENGFVGKFYVLPGTKRQQG